jgi:hypothetical protein
VHFRFGSAPPHSPKLGGKGGYMFTAKRKA